jgi:hypothetical protein
MVFPHRASRFFTGIMLCLALSAAGCGGRVEEQTGSAVPTETLSGDAPRITDVRLDRTEVPRYESIDMTVSLDAEYSNPYDFRQVRLDALFEGPDGIGMNVPGFWDGNESWRIRFTPSREGTWSYGISVRDSRGASGTAEGSFRVTASERHGWVRAGNLVDPAYSSRYLAYDDGTPFYGIGHCDALNILVGGFSVETGVGLFDGMRQGRENYVVWWPQYSMSPVSNSYDQYSLNNLGTIDVIVKDAQAKGILLVFTVWDHPSLRDSTHSLGGGRWESNGFSKLGDTEFFFNDPEGWDWQANLYRYMIARWGYSPAIGMWQTVSEINLTSARDRLDPWHAKVNAFFVENDPYRHPTTASFSGEGAWPQGWMAMDVPQVHLYDFSNGSLEWDAVHAAQVLADWTQRMWAAEAKPNWVGEFGVSGNTVYPELFHHAIWAALAAGAGSMPAEWNGGTWGEMTPEMLADTARMADFLADIPLVRWNPSALKIAGTAPMIRGWGVAGKDGGLFWIQDAAMEGKPIGDVRSYSAVRRGVVVEISGLAEGRYTVTPFDTWKGTFLAPVGITCGGVPCAVPLPEFTSDMAFRLERR